MRYSQLARRAGVPVAAAVLGALVATPALADVTVSPTTAYQGGAENLTLHVTNDGAQPIHTITVKFRDDTPLAEAYPLSVPDWAPKITMRKISTPLTTVHGDNKTTDVAASITWLAMPGKDLQPGKSTDLAVAVGPLPQLSSIQLDVATTLPDGKAGPALTSPTLTLTPDPTGQKAAHAHSINGGSGTTAGEQAAQEAELFQAAIEEAGRGPSIWSIGGWVVAGLALLGGAFVMWRSRHRADEEPDDSAPEEEPATEEKEPVAAGSGTSKWAYKG
ncbi:hypothetical protein Aab01nite_15190 [Paractinoplanes abujensis]|uniref:YncI copper-binding domain-containing protein n=1 Tax=Paractinoplanes abujensis TaxID=882441 RepID=A0A7W7CLE6_9ACTN|nr:DUF1775 domain-containing protein [Actinoplanes abujensis]MBB4690658.1 hypothetical protein [Actinoplanes abujensis]GID17929.1 hypothetical protein Aab01nite_15190 [Actinoplanes abujensis]